MHPIETYRQYSRSVARASGKPVVVFDAEEATSLFKSYPFLIPYVGRDVKGWRMTQHFVAARDNLSNVQQFIADKVKNGSTSYAFGVIDATPNSMEIGVFVKEARAAGALTDEEFLDGEDPRKPIVGA